MRQRLSGLRAQREQARLQADEVADRIRLAVRDALNIGVPMTEIARLLGMDRSSVYRTYID